VEVALDGRESFDPDGDVLTYSWTLEAPAESAAALDDASSPTPTFTADIAGAYAAILVVSDGALESPADEVVIMAVEVVEALDGEMLYKDNCESCHRPFAEEDPWTFEQINAAIENIGVMRSIDLPPEEIQAIADALAARP